MHISLLPPYILHVLNIGLCSLSIAAVMTTYVPCYVILCVIHNLCLDAALGFARPRVHHLVTEKYGLVWWDCLYDSLIDLKTAVVG